MLRMLCITAHPDDEAGGFGGSLLLYHDRGIETYVICLTPGQAARNRGGARTDEELSAMRRKEFASSCELLKVTQGEVLNYSDGRLDRTDFYPVVAELALRIRRIRPQVILTLGPEGGVTGHPDHSMAGTFATLAYHWAGRNDRFTEQLANGAKPHAAQKLYYATAPFTLPGRQPVALSPATATIEVGPYLDTKIAAFRRHTSQAPLFDSVEKYLRQRGPKEWFHLAACSTPSVITPETDLMGGVKDGG